MRALVTGGAGFIGSHLVEKLVKKKYKVTVIDNLSNGKLNNLQSVKKKITFIKADLNKIKNLNKLLKKTDYVFHLSGLVKATESIKKPKKYFKSNVLSTLNILNSLNNTSIKKIIYAASASCYGKTKNFPISENNKIFNLTPYASTKWLSEKLLFEFSKNNKISIISLRLFNVYGSRSDNKSTYSGVVTQFINNFKKNKPLKIYGSGKQTRSFVHVDDVVNAFINLAQSKIKNEIFNIGGKRSIKITELANFISQKKIFLPARKGDPKYSSANISKIKKKIGWSPKVDIKTGINLLISLK
tara:strand:+ start:1209 stop:2108 length:900 start_codon:yes stop_codon:yes gene_type:complete